MSTFKVGDKVRIKKACSGVKVGEICTVQTVGFSNKTLYAVPDVGIKHGCSCENEWELITSPNPVGIFHYSNIVDSYNGITTVCCDGTTTVSGAWITTTPQEKLTIKSKIMGIIRTIKNRLTPEPKKSFIKFGIIMENGELTTEGRDIMCQHYFDNNQALLEKDILVPLKEQEAENKKEFN